MGTFQGGPATDCSTVCLKCPMDSLLLFVNLNINKLALQFSPLENGTGVFGFRLRVAASPLAVLVPPSLDMDHRTFSCLGKAYVPMLGAERKHAGKRRGGHVINKLSDDRPPGKRSCQVACCTV